MRLAGRIALVTGAHRGIGRAMALALAAEGAAVAVNYRRHEAPAREVVEAIVAAGGRALAVWADVGERSAVEAMFIRVDAEFGPVDVLVNSAAAEAQPTPITEVTDEIFDRTFAANVRGAFLCSQLAVRRLLELGRPGAIVNISSVHARTSVPGLTAYAASKGALDAMSRQMAVELAPHGIRVNVVSPGFIDTERNRDAIAGYDAAAEGRKIPMGRVGTPEEIAALVVFLASDETPFMTGQVIIADGGVECRLGRR
jgi:NAD(P)-dependent dehydrogenase (short-subunit alcohol dehydrogenase family)